MYAIYAFWLEEQAPLSSGDGAGKLIGCLTDCPSHGSDLGGGKPAPPRPRWVPKRWITNGSIAGVAIVRAKVEEDRRLPGRGRQGSARQTSRQISMRLDFR
jgi:alkylation response protein AidB-like acyl-CoA dehydrogenase